MGGLIYPEAGFVKPQNERLILRLEKSRDLYDYDQKSFHNSRLGREAR